MGCPSFSQFRGGTPPSAEFIPAAKTRTEGQSSEKLARIKAAKHRSLTA